MPLDQALAVTGALQDLLSICCNETSKVASLSLTSEKGDLIPVKAFVRTRGYKTEGKESSVYPVLSFNDIGRMNGVAKWLETTERYGLPVMLLTSNWYNDGAYNEDKLSRMYTAIEGMVSKKKGCTTARIRTNELAEFAEDNIPEFESVSNREAKEWAKTVKEIRDRRLSHADPSSKLMPDGREMHVMTNVLYTAGTSFLLKEMGMGKEQIEKHIRECRLTMLLSEQQ